MSEEELQEIVLLCENTVIDAGSPVPIEGDLRWRMGGYKRPQSEIFRLKTAAVDMKRQDILTDELPRLWLA